MSRDISEDDIRPLGRRKTRKPDTGYSAIPYTGTSIAHSYIAPPEEVHPDQEFVDELKRHFERLQRETDNKRHEQQYITREHSRINEDSLKVDEKRTRLEAELKRLYEEIAKLNRANDKVQQSILSQKWFLLILAILLLLGVTNLLILLFVSI